MDSTHGDDLLPLLNRLRERNADDTVWDAFLAHQGPYIRSACRSQLAGEGWIDDAMQEALLAIRRGLPSFEARSGAEAERWIWTVSVRVAKDIRRSETARHRRERHASRTWPTGAGGSGREDGFDGETIEWVRGLLADLPEQERDVIRLRFLDGLSADAVARRLRLHRSTVYRLCTQAITRLRCHLQPTRGAAAVPGLAVLVLFRAEVHGAVAPRTATTAETDATATTPQGTGEAPHPPMPWRWLGIGVAMVAALAAGWWGMTAPEVVLATGRLEIGRERNGPSGRLGPGEVIPRRTILRSPTDHTAELVWSDAPGTRCRLQPDSVVTLRPAGPGLTLGAGGVRFETAGSLTIGTDHLEADLREGRGFLVVTDDDEPCSRIDLLAGTAVVRAGGRELVLRAGQAWWADATASAPEPIDSPGREFSPRFGGRFFRETAAAYAAGRWFLATGAPAIPPPRGPSPASLLARAYASSNASVHQDPDGRIRIARSRGSEPIFLRLPLPDPLPAEGAFALRCVPAPGPDGKPPAVFGTGFGPLVAIPPPPGLPGSGAAELGQELALRYRWREVGQDRNGLAMVECLVENAGTPLHRQLGGGAPVEVELRWSNGGATVHWGGSTWTR